MLDTKNLWDRVLADIELSVSKANFGTWFRNTNISHIDQGVVFVSVPNTFVRDWLANKYHKNILKSLRDTSPEVRALEYLISRLDNKLSSRTETTVSVTVPDNQLGLNELYINRDSNLNPKYTFDSFIVGPFNDFAYAAAQAVIKSPGVGRNPLYIYGPTGVGKTHLIQAIGNHLKKQNESWKVYYVTSEGFTLDFVNSVQNKKGNLFKEKYRKYDCLIIDDVQFFGGKQGTQEELFHLFNNFHENNKQIIFSSDKPPKQIQGLEDRLRTRFEGGTVADVSKPDYESRLAILRNKACELKCSVSDELLEYIAQVIQDSVRELEGSLNTIVCQIQAKNREISLSEVKNLIKHNIKPPHSIALKDVIRVVAEFYNIEEKILLEKTRRKEIVKPRQIIMYLLREDLNTSFPYIGQKLGGRDHTTVIHACEKIKEEIKSDTVLSQEIEQIRNFLYSTV